MHRNTTKLQSFDCEADPVPPNTPAATRPSKRSRLFDLSAPYHPPSLLLFDCETVDLPDGTSAVPRPQGKERRLPPEAVVGQVEQKVVSILLDPHPAPGERAPSEVEYFREYLSEGWKVKQLTSVSTGGAFGWIVVLLEREPEAKEDAALF